MNNLPTLPTILIVDDTPENLFALEKLLIKLDVNIIKAKSGNEALTATLYHDFSMILLDVNMPDMDGYEVAELLKKDDRTADIPIIFITAMNKSDTLEIKGYSKGAIDFIFKPINEIILIYKIKVFLELFMMKKRIENMMSRQITRKPKILIVDDNPENLLALELLLRKLDVDIVKADSGNETLSCVMNNDFALIILDVQMPEMDGFEVADILKSDENTETIPIIFVTAIDMDDAKEIKGYDKGAVDFIFKPFNEYILISKVKVFLEIYKIKCGLETLVADRTQMLMASNIKLRDEITRHKRTAEDLAKAKSYLDSVFNSISLVLITLDSDRNITNMNREAEKTSGISFKDAKGKGIKEIFPFYLEFFNEIKRSMDLRQPIERTHITICIDNEFYINNLAVYPLNINDIRGAVVRVDDITEKVQIDEMMIQSEKMLTIGGLAAGMAHEINNPLAGMMQTAQVMANRFGENMDNQANLKAAEKAGISIDAIQKFMDDRGLFRMVARIRESGERATEIVQNILSFARKGESIPSIHNLEELIDKTVDLAGSDYNLKKKYDFRQIEIVRDYEENLPPVSCEGSKIQQVLLNILRNGAEAMQEAGTKKPKFILRTCYDKERKMNTIEIKDNGPGMKEEVCKRIFEPFFTTKPEGVGTGLGMSVSYFIITENHKGEMAVESTYGKGTKFIIRLPI